MASIGVEYIHHFPHVRAAGQVKSGGQDVATCYYVAEHFAARLRHHGHTIRFLWGETDVWEKDLRDETLGGIDRDLADGVDLFLIATHGNYENRGVSLLYDTEIDKWLGKSDEWRLGDTCNLEWLMIFGCHSIDLNNLLDHLPVFKGLHLFCGAYGDMWDSWTVQEAGGDVADDMTDGKAVSYSWRDGMSDWWVDNHPMILSVEREETYNGGDIIWEETTIRSDRLWGHGVTRPDIGPAHQYLDGNDLGGWWWANLIATVAHYRAEG